MALIEVDEEDYKVNAAARALLDKMATKPGQREKLLRLVKETSPELHIPEIDAADPLRNEIKSIREELGGELKELRKLRDDEKSSNEIGKKIEVERAKLRRAGWDDDGIREVEECMQREGIGSYNAAAALVEKEQVKPTPTDNAFGDKGWNLFGTDGRDATAYEGILDSPNAWKKFQKEEVSRFFADKKAGRLQ